MLPCLLAAFNRVDYSLLAIFFSAFMTHLFSTYVSGQSFNVSSLASLPLPSLKMMFLRILSWSLYSLYVLSLGKFIHSHGLSLQSLSICIVRSECSLYLQTSMSNLLLNPMSYISNSV